jgi:hypothetical protein
VADEDSVVTGEDIEDLNRAVIRRAGVFAQIAGAALVVVGAVGLAAWAWIVIRQQLLRDGSSFSFDSGDRTTLAVRIDILAGTFGYLVEPAVALTIGLAVRLLSGVLLARAGVSLTGFEPGEPFPSGTDE